MNQGISADPATAQHPVSVIEDAGLSGGHGPGGCVEADRGGSLGSSRFDCGGRAGMVVPDLSDALEGFRRLIPGNPVAVVDGEFGAAQLRFVADNDSIIRRV